MENPKHERMLQHAANPSNHREFEYSANYPRLLAGIFIEEQYGERCEDFEPDCECCKKWALHDQLFANPFVSKPNAVIEVRSAPIMESAQEAISKSIQAAKAKKLCGMSSHHESCDCDGVGGDR